MTTEQENSTIMITLIGGDYVPHEQAITHRHNSFCGSRNKWDYGVFHNKIRPHRNWSWNKLDCILDAFERGYDRVIWCDADCLPIEDREMSFLAEGLWVSQDFNGPCCGFMSIDRCMVPMIAAWAQLGPLDDWSKYDNRDTWEQNTFKFLLENFAKYRNQVYLIPEEAVSNPGTKGLKVLPTFHHFWGNSGLDSFSYYIRQPQGLCDEYFRGKGILEGHEQDPADPVQDPGQAS